MKSRTRTPVTLLLLAGILVCIALLPWGRWLQRAPDFDQRLTECAARYTDLRKQDDWMTMWTMIDPRDRQKVGKPLYLSYYGQGMLKVHSLVEKSREIDVSKRTARIKFGMEGELLYDSLPARIRSTMARPDPGTLRQATDVDTEWSLIDGTWWLRMDRQVLTGEAPDGRKTTPEQGPQPEPKK